MGFLGIWFEATWYIHINSIDYNDGIGRFQGKTTCYQEIKVSAKLTLPHERLGRR